MSPHRAGQEAAQAMVGLIVGENGAPKTPLLERLIPGVGTAGMALPELTWWPQYSAHLKLRRGHASAQWSGLGSLHSSSMCNSMYSHSAFSAYTCSIFLRLSEYCFHVEI
jgi:hypothetical protein